jgi:hypothetical protein
MTFITMKKLTLLFFGFIAFYSQAQVIYTDVNPDSLVSSSYELDLNNDGTPEFRIEKTTDGGIDIVQATGLSNQDSLIGYYAGFPAITGYPSALSSNEIIDSTSTFVDEGVMGGDHELIMEDADWPDGFNRYLGLKFNISGEVHYGWAKIKISTDYAAFTISEYAYSATAGEAINSGITLIEDNYSSISEMTIFPNPSAENATLSFYLNDESVIDLSVYDLSGKLILAESRKTEKPGKQAFQLNVSQWNAGIYFCRVNSSTLKLSVVH